ncbi:hypothetical protein PR048_011299 [Dryococelus australis]|uniref:Uncharacterized protein n=1 Tax=Dryococelus australis TaxID=614101 RepID=A0ABQ9HL63_9NEOP|nr:hypothetical protein PR048_011299 [Dryococelus australis]
MRLLSSEPLLREPIISLAPYHGLFSLPHSTVCADHLDNTCWSSVCIFQLLCEAYILQYQLFDVVSKLLGIGTSAVHMTNTYAVSVGGQQSSVACTLETISFKANCNSFRVFFIFISHLHSVSLLVPDVRMCTPVLLTLPPDIRLGCPAYVVGCCFTSVSAMLLIKEQNVIMSPAYFKLIEECVSQIVLHRGGCDPDFRANRRFQIDVQPLIDSLVGFVDFEKHKNNIQAYNRNYQKGDYISLYLAVNSFDWLPIFQMEDVNSVAVYLTSNLQLLINPCFPKSKFTKNKYPVKFSRDLIRLLIRRNIFTDFTKK